MGKIIVLDYDGCIASTADPYSVNASLFHAQILADILKSIKANIIFCSGRGMESLEEAAKDFETYGIEVTSIIGEGGVFIKDRKTGKIEVIAKAEQIEFIRRLKNFFIDFADGNNYVVQDNKESAITLFRNERIYSDDQFYIKFQDIMGYLISSGLIKETDLDKLQIFQTVEGIDIYPSSVGKDKALRRILASIELDETIIGAGDGKNDVKWLKLLKSEFGGIVITPSNGVDEVKKIADFIGEGDNIKGIIDSFYKYLGYCVAIDKNEEIQYVLSV